MLTEVSKPIEQVLPRVAGRCVLDFSQPVCHKNFRCIYSPKPLYVGCDLFFYSVTTGAVAVPRRLNEPPLV